MKIKHLLSITEEDYQVLYNFYMTIVKDNPELDLEYLLEMIVEEKQYDNINDITIEYTR